NGGVLPLAPSANMLLTGPAADSMVQQLGGWSVSWQGLHTSGHQCCEGPPGQIPPGTTVFRGMAALSPTTAFVRTSPSLLPDELPAAVAAAATADAVVVTVGERAYAEGLGDDPAPALPSDQKALIAALEATGKPVIVVVITGRPIGLGALNEQNAAAIVVSFQGSTEAGQAVAEVLFGNVNPSGKLPLTWPGDADARPAYAANSDFNAQAPSPLGDQPKVLDQLPSTSVGTSNGYNPLYSVGFGLSYTTFSTSALSVSSPSNGALTATFTVTNTGTRSGIHIVPVFVHQPVSDVVVPAHRLVGFTRVSVDPGESQQVKVTFPVSPRAVTPGDIDSTAAPVVEPGTYVVEIPNQVRPNNLFPQGGPLTATFTLS